MQGMMVAELLMDHLARTHGKDAAEMRELNMYKEGDTTHFKQILDGCQASTVQIRLPQDNPSTRVSHLH